MSLSECGRVSAEGMTRAAARMGRRNAGATAARDCEVPHRDPREKRRAHPEVRSARRWWRERRRDRKAARLTAERDDKQNLLTPAPLPGAPFTGKLRCNRGGGMDIRPNPLAVFQDINSEFNLLNTNLVSASSLAVFNLEN
jgi:hypothetical protein